MGGSRYIAAALLMLASCTAVQAQSLISRAIFADGKLWLLEHDKLSTLVKDYPRRTVPLDQPALDLIRDHGNPVIVSCDTKNCENWVVKRWINGGWSVEAKAPVSNESLLALAGGTRIALITNHRVITFLNGAGRTTRYKPAGYYEPAGWITSTLATPSYIWIGRDAGEWGGSLERIDIATGQSTDVQGYIPTGPPDPNSAVNHGPIITNVNALLTHPWNSHCILVAQGLIHLGMASGEIVQVCDGKVLPFYQADLGNRWSVPFYGLAKGRDGIVWAAGIDGLYRITAKGRARRMPMPRFSTTGGAAVSFMTSDLALVLTETHRRASVSGSAPMLVPLDDPK